MKPGDHPEFFQFPAPAGRSRESTIVLDRLGRFSHDGTPVEKPSMNRAFAQWIRRHPDNQRYILSNGYDWTYFTVEDVPFFVEAVRLDSGSDEPHPTLVLSDGSEEALNPEGIRVGSQDAIYVRVKGGSYEARFTQSAQTTLAPILVAGRNAEEVGLRLGKTVYWVALRSPTESAKRGP